MRSSCEGDAPGGMGAERAIVERLSEEGLTDDERKKFGN